MSRISLTTECAAAIDEARWVTRARYHHELIKAALDGNEAALQAIASGWPSDTAGPRSVFITVRQEDLDRLAELASGADDKPAMGPQAPAMLGLSEMIRVYLAG